MGNKNNLINNIEDTSINNDQFVIYKLLKLLYKNNTIKEDNRVTLSQNVTVLTANIKSFSELIKNMKEKELFSYVNESLEQMTIPVKEYGGMIYQYIGSGFNSFFLDKPENALHAAINICEYVRNYEEGAISLCYGSIMIGIMGTNEDVMPIVISEAAGLTEYLQKIAPNYYSKILITGSFADKIDNFNEGYLKRFLGYIFIKSSNSIEKLYDVFQADTSEDIYMKRKTRLMFEEGVKLYTEFNYRMARLHFIEVLKVFRKDAAAKKYLLMCDAYLKSKSHIKKQAVIEIY